MKTTLKRTFLAALPVVGLLMIAPVASAHGPDAYDQYGYGGGPYYEDEGGHPCDQYGYEGGPYYDDDDRDDSYNQYGYGRQPYYGDPRYGTQPYYGGGYYPGSPDLSSSSPLLGSLLGILLPR